MFWKRVFATKSLEMLHDEMEGDNRLRRVLGPIGLTSLGVGAIIGAGIFVITGRVAAQDAGPSIILSFCVAGFACALAAMCYAEFASMAPVAGSAYTYAYATLGELFAWIIGWDLVLEYALSAATVSSAWSEYLNKLLEVCFGGRHARIPEFLCNDPFSKAGAWFNLPAVAILAVVTTILVIGIRESAMSNTVMVVVKLGVVLFVIAIGVQYINPGNWTDIPTSERKLPEDWLIPEYAEKYIAIEERLLKTAEEYALFHGHKDVGEVQVWPRTGKTEILTPTTQKAEQRIEHLKKQAIATFRIKMAHELASAEQAKKVEAKYSPDLPKTAQEKSLVQGLLAEVGKEAPKKSTQKWGLLGFLGLNTMLAQIDDASRSNFMPFGFSGMMLGAALVFFAFIGFDSISTHSEEAVRPQRDVPFGILTSLVLCTVLYIAVAGIITSMEPYTDIDPKAAVAEAFNRQAHLTDNPLLKISAAIIALGALAGMTSVLLITFLSQARIFLAMARDGLVPHAVFGVVHPKFKTPHISTIITGCIMAVVAALTPITLLEEMVNIGTLFAFVVVCAAVLILRLRRPTRYQINEKSLKNLRMPCAEYQSAEELQKPCGPFEALPETIASRLREHLDMRPMPEPLFRQALAKVFLTPEEFVKFTEGQIPAPAEVTKYEQNMLHRYTIPEEIISKLSSLQNKEPLPEAEFRQELAKVLTPEELKKYEDKLLNCIANPRRPFRCPLVFLVAPLGILVNVIMMLFLPIDTWGRLVVWLIIGLTIFFTFGWRNSIMGKRERGEPLPHWYTLDNPGEKAVKPVGAGH